MLTIFVMQAYISSLKVHTYLQYSCFTIYDIYLQHYTITFLFIVYGLCMAVYGGLYAI